MRSRYAFLVVALGAIVCTPADAQTRTPAWLAAAYSDADFFPGESPVWTDWSAMRGLVQRRVGSTTLGIEVASIGRFDERDERIAAEVYAELWQGAYAHLRTSVTPEARLVPLSDWRLEVFQTVAGPWEASGSIGLMNLRESDVTLVGLGMARYLRNWYLRGRASIAELAGERTSSGAVFARRFFRDSREFIEVGTGLGSENVVIGPGPVLDTRDTWFVAVVLQRFVTESLGIHASASLNDFERIPRRRHLTVGLLARF